MTFEEFNKLNLDQRCDAIWEWGFYVSRRKEGDTNKVLYSLNGYFAEMSIRISDTNVVEVKALLKSDLKLEDSYLINKDNPFIRRLGLVQ